MLPDSTVVAYLVNNASAVLCVDLLLLLKPIHTADATQLDSLVASASAVCIDFYILSQIAVFV